MSETRSPVSAVVDHFLRSFVANDLEGMLALLAEDCVDANPYPIQPPGRDGIVFKAALFHSRHRGSEISVTNVVDERGLVVVEWTTRFPGGLRTDWRGRFTVTDGHVRAFEVDRVA